MPFARKLILHVPVSDETLLGCFVEQCLNDGVSLVAVVGEDCARIEDIIDEIVGSVASDEAQFCTTSHPDEPLEDVLNMARTWEFQRGDPVQEVHL